MVIVNFFLVCVLICFLGRLAVISLLSILPVVVSVFVHVRVCVCVCQCVTVCLTVCFDRPGIEEDQLCAAKEIVRD